MYKMYRIDVEIEGDIHKTVQFIVLDEYMVQLMYQVLGTRTETYATLLIEYSTYPHLLAIAHEMNKKLKREGNYFPYIHTTQGQG